jgi:hypothetical protein
MRFAFMQFSALRMIENLCLKFAANCAARFYFRAGRAEIQSSLTLIA